MFLNIKKSQCKNKKNGTIYLKKKIKKYKYNLFKLKPIVF